MKSMRPSRGTRLVSGFGNLNAESASRAACLPYRISPSLRTASSKMSPWMKAAGKVSSVDLYSLCPKSQNSRRKSMPIRLCTGNPSAATFRRSVPKQTPTSRKRGSARDFEASKNALYDGKVLIFNLRTYNDPSERCIHTIPLLYRHT